MRPQRLPGLNARDAGRRWALGEMRVDLSSCALGRRLEKDRSAARHAPSSPYSRPRFSGTSPMDPDPGKFPLGRGVPTPGAKPVLSQRWAPAPAHPRLPSPPFLCPRFLSFLRKDWRWVAGAFPSERGCEFRVWGGILSEPRRPGPPRARSEGQTGRLGGEETPYPGGARSGVRRAYLRQPSPCRTL